MSKHNGRAAACEIRGCGARVHGNGLCRRHYDEDRYLQTTGRSPEAVAEAQREQAIEGELTLGCVAEWHSPYGTNSMFADDEERRAAWEERREALMVNYLTPPLLPGHRPFAWWRYEAGRPQHLTEHPPPLDFETPQDRWLRPYEYVHVEVGDRASGGDRPIVGRAAAVEFRFVSARCGSRSAPGSRRRAG